MTIFFAEYTCEMASHIKDKHIKMKPRIYVLGYFCLTWTVNANSLKTKQCIVIKEICSVGCQLFFCEQNLLLFIKPGVATKTALIALLKTPTRRISCIRGDDATASSDSISCCDISTGACSKVVCTCDLFISQFRYVIILQQSHEHDHSTRDAHPAIKY